MELRRGLYAAIVLVAAVLASPRADNPPLEPPTPNFLLVVSDDQTWDNFTRELMPNTFADLVDQGMSFDRAYDASTLCCPSRAEILTGLFESHTGVDANNVPLDRFTIVDALHDLGYRTSLTGKWLNSELCDPKPSFDQWVCVGSGPSTYSLKDPTLNVNGEWVDFTGYQTDILSDFTVDFIDATPPDQPFFALYTPTSPHLPANDDRCSQIPVELHRPPSYDEDTQSGEKPAYVARPPLSRLEKQQIDAQYRAMTRAVPCLDGSIGALLDGLEASGRAQNTMVVFISDNGFLFGEHRRWDKEVPYEEASHVPLVIRYPAMLPLDQPTTTTALVQNIDITPTIADILGIHWGADGLSLVPLLTRSAPTVRTGAIIQHCEGVTAPCTPEILPFNQSAPPSSNAIITDAYALIEHITGETELYDLAGDPYEMNNLAGESGYEEIQAQLSADLAELHAPPVPDTTIVTGPDGDLASRLGTFTYFSQSLLATYECRVDRGALAGTWIACSQDGVTVGPLTDGNYTFNVRGTDEHGVTDSTPDKRQFTIRSTGPDAFLTSAPPAHTKDSTLTFEFLSHAPDVTFECQIGLVGTVGTWSPCSSPATYGPLSDGSWVFQVRAIDGTGDVSEPPAQDRVRVDNRGPVVTFRVAPREYTPTTSASFRFFATEPLLGGFGCSLDRAPESDCSSGTFFASDLTAGLHSLVVSATDDLGSLGKTKYSWTVDVALPNLAVTGPSNYSNLRTADFVFTPSEKVNPHVGVTCALDGEDLVNTIYLASSCKSGAVSVKGLTEGPHTLEAAALDLAGNVATIATFSWTVDTILPVARITSGPPDPTNQTHARFFFSARDATPVTFMCSLDGAPASACDPGITYTGLSVGTHTFTVSPTDAAQNIGSSVVWTWTITG
jgi:N-acetylglucosamine-6-sulfatase